MRKDRRVLRAALRWTAAVVVFAVAGAGTAYGITRMERTDVPGPATESDGRWTYPRLTKPPLPSGSPGPQADSNPAGTHHADLRALLLPAPEGAEEIKALRGTDGWPATGDFLQEYADKDDRETFGQQLVDGGLRHIAARGRTAGDGTRTRIHLLRFDTAAMVDDAFFRTHFFYTEPAYPLRGAGNAGRDASFPAETAPVFGVQRSLYDDSKPYGAEHDRQAHLAAGDVLAVVLRSRKGPRPPCRSGRRWSCRAGCWADGCGAVPRPPGAGPGRVSWDRPRAHHRTPRSRSTPWLSSSKPCWSSSPSAFSPSLD